MAASILRPILLATLVAGTLDLISAFVFAGMAGGTPIGVLRYVASGPFGEAPTATPGWAAIGAAVHFTIMLCMATAYLLIAPRFAQLMRHPILAGIAYGVLLWLIMYFLVKPLRWPETPIPHTAWAISNQLFSHCILTGIPIAWIASRWHRSRALA